MGYNWSLLGFYKRFWYGKPLLACLQLFFTGLWRCKPFDSLYSATLWLRIPMDDEVSIHFYVILWVRGWGCFWGWWKFCSSMAFRVRGVGNRETLLGTVGLAGSGDLSGGAILLLRNLLRVGYVEKAWNHRCVATLFWSSSPAWEVELTPLVWRAAVFLS